MKVFVGQTNQHTKGHPIPSGSPWDAVPAVFSMFLSFSQKIKRKFEKSSIFVPLKIYLERKEGIHLQLWRVVTLQILTYTSSQTPHWCTSGIGGHELEEYMTLGTIGCPRGSALVFGTAWGRTLDRQIPQASDVPRDNTPQLAAIQSLGCIQWGICILYIIRLERHENCAKAD